MTETVLWQNEDLTTFPRTINLSDSIKNYDEIHFIQMDNVSAGFVWLTPVSFLTSYITPGMGIITANDAYQNVFTFSSDYSTMTYQEGTSTLNLIPWTVIGIKY